MFLDPFSYLGIHHEKHSKLTHTRRTGGQELKQRYEQKAREIDTDGYWRVHDWNVQVIAAKTVKQDPDSWEKKAVEVGKVKEKRKRALDEAGTQSKYRKVKKETLKGGKDKKIENAHLSTKDHLTAPSEHLAKPINPYEGKDEALQLNEPIDDFLLRLRPSSTDTSHPWIFCANFHSGERSTAPDIAGFKQLGTRLLDTFSNKRKELERKFDPPKAEGVITRMMTNDRVDLEAEIMAAAKRCHLMSGKWMLFPTRDKVDRYWEAVVRWTVDGSLGTAAKVATRPENPSDPTQVICVYTKDITDREDIKRVLLELVRLKLAPAVTEAGAAAKKGNGRGKEFVKGQIWYKPDCYTWLEITSGNEYRIKPTLYGTASLLTGEDMRRLGR